MVCGQEPGYLLCANEAGAPGHIPGDSELFPRGHDFQYLVIEPVQKAEFSVVDTLGAKGELLMGGEGGEWRASPAGCLHPSPSSMLISRIPHYSGFRTNSVFSATPLTSTLNPVEARSTGGLAGYLSATSAVEDTG